MTKEITRARIIQEIEDRFKLRELEPEVFSFSERVVPIYNIDHHLKTWESNYKEITVTATGGKVFFTVPDNERWTLNRYNVIFLGSGAFTVAGIYLLRSGSLSYFVYLDLTAGQTVSYANDLPKPVVLDSKDKLSVNIDGYTSTQNLRLYIDYIREVLR